MNRSRTRTAAIRGLLILAGWTLFALFSISQSFLVRAYNSRVNMRPMVLFDTVESAIWAALTPLVFWLAGKLVIRGANWRWTIPASVAVGMAFSLAHLTIMVQFFPLIGYRTGPAIIRTVMLNRFHTGVLVCWALIGLRHAIEYYRQFRMRELAASQLEAKLALARLEMLKMQLQPHFLFNTMHAISALMYRDLPAADRMIARLSDFLRLTLDSAGVQEVPLRREMEYLDKYLEIEEVRFGDRLTVRRAIESETLDLLVPNLVLQPLVENAVRHGIAPRTVGGSIEIAALVQGGTLLIEVTDDGAGPDGEIREGVGLSNTRARIEQLYGAGAKLELGATPERGFRAAIRIPLNREGSHASPDRG